MKKIVLALLLITSLVGKSQSPHFLNQVKNTDGYIYFPGALLKLGNGNKIAGVELANGLASLNEGGFITFNINGNIVWHKTIEDYYPTSMVENGTSFYCTQAASHGWSFISKNNSANGNFTWFKSISISNPLIQPGIQARKIFKEGSNSAVSINGSDANSTNYSFLAKIDGNGNAVSCNRLDSLYTSSITQINNNYLLLGKRDWQSTDSTYFLMLLDANLTAIWSKKIENPTKTNLVIAGTDNNSIFISGSNVAGDGAILKFDLLGNLVWSKIYYSTEPTFGSLTFSNVIYKSNKLYALAYVYDDSYNSYTSVTTLDLNGNFLKNRLIGYNSQMIYSDLVINLSDTSIFAIGSIDNNPGNNSGMYETQFSLDGDLESCVADSLIIADSSFLPLITASPIFTPVSETITTSSLPTPSVVETPYLEAARTHIDSIVPTLPSCANPCSGDETVYFSGMDQNPQFDWSSNANGQTGSYINALCAGTYSVTLTDIFGCTDTATVQLNNELPITPEICMVTVDSAGNNNIIYWDKSAYGIKDTFIIYRDLSNNNYMPIGQVPFDSISMFIDTVRTLYPANGDPNASSWRYKISVKDSCGTESILSPYHQTLFIQNTLGNFSWNHYEIEGQPMPVPTLLNYEFIRDDLNNGNWAVIQLLSASSTAYTDANYTTHQALANWRIETIFSYSCTPTLRLKNNNEVNTVVVKSKSNIKNNRTVDLGNKLENKTTEFNFYPNPAKDAIVLNTKANNKEIQIELINTLGQKVIVLKSKNDVIEIDLSNIAPGAYIIKVTQEDGTSTKKLIIE